MEQTIDPITPVRYPSAIRTKPSTDVTGQQHDGVDTTPIRSNFNVEQMEKFRASMTAVSDLLAMGHVRGRLCNGLYSLFPAK